MKYRKLRIAWSVVSGICCALVFVLWVNSFLSYRHIKSVPPLGSIYLSQGWVQYSEIAPHYSLNYPQRHNRRNILPLAPVAACAAMLTIAPWLPWRFSLRTLLLATTAAAALLGFAIYATQG